MVFLWHSYIFVFNTTFLYGTWYSAGLGGSLPRLAFSDVKGTPDRNACEFVETGLININTAQHINRQNGTLVEY